LDRTVQTMLEGGATPTAISERRMSRRIHLDDASLGHTLSLVAFARACQGCYDRPVPEFRR
jgi:hypothetical protein